MRRIYKILATSALAAIPVVWVSAQQFPTRQDSPQDRRFESGGPRPSQEPFGGNNQPDANRAANSFGSGAATYTAKPLPKEFAILNSKSIFSKDHMAVSADRAKPVFAGTQSSLFFRGVMKEGDHFLANIEDNSSHKIQWVSIGDLLTFNGARINEITLDHIVVNRGGTPRMIGIGDSLDGGRELPVQQPAPTAAAAPTSTNSAAPTAAASTAGTASEDAVLEAMKARRQRELGQ